MECVSDPEVSLNPEMTVCWFPEGWTHDTQSLLTLWYTLGGMGSDRGSVDLTLVWGLDIGWSW